MTGLNIADWFVLLLLFISTAIGFYRGFLREMLTVITWIIAGMIATSYGKDVGEIFVFVETPALKEVFGIFAVFMSIVFVGFVFKYLICRAFNITGASKLDRLAGGVFGWIRASAIIIGVILASPPAVFQQNWYQKSVIMPKYNTIAQAIVKATPQSFRDMLKKDMDAMSFERMQRNAQKQIQQMQQKHQQEPAEQDIPGKQTSLEIDPELEFVVTEDSLFG
jgi:membrane protein required for colicin V production